MLAPSESVQGAKGVHWTPDASEAMGEQVGAAAGEQSQTAGRWMTQQGGNSRRAAGGEGSGRATPLCTQLDSNYTCWNTMWLLRRFFEGVKLQIIFVLILKIVSPNEGRLWRWLEMKEEKGSLLPS